MVKVTVYYKGENPNTYECTYAKINEGILEIGYSSEDTKAAFLKLICIPAKLTERIEILVPTQEDFDKYKKFIGGSSEK